jgi:hypothetical protein
MYADGAPFLPMAFLFMLYDPNQVQSAFWDISITAPLHTSLINQLIQQPFKMNSTKQTNNPRILMLHPYLRSPELASLGLPIR